MAVWISRVRIKGVRGFNEEAIVDLGPTLNLLVGKNGAGKTSFLQAIEWCLTGKMKYLEGDEFSREDAIINLFNQSGSGRVTLTLQTPNGELELSRTRKRGKSTTRGSSPVQLKIGSRVLEDVEAEDYLEKTLGLPLDDLSNSVYLHQAALRAILSDDPKERSRSIDKMLGMEEIRTFAEALSTKRNLTKAERELQTRIETLRRDKVQFALMTKETVEKAREALISKGFSENDFDVISQVAFASTIAEKSGSLKTKYGFSGAIPDRPRADVVSVSRFVKEMVETLRMIDRRRTESIQAVYKVRIRFESLKQKLIQDSEEVRMLSENSASNLEKEKRLSEEEAKLALSLAEKTKTVSRLNSHVSVLLRAQDRVRSIRASRLRIQDGISKVQQAVGDEVSHDRIIAEQRAKVSNVESKLESLGSLEKILDSALDYLEGSKATKCPVCEQSISAEAVIIEIRKKMNKSVRGEIEGLKTDKKAALSQIHVLESSLKELKNLHGQLQDETSREMDAIRDAEKELEISLKDNLDLMTESKKEELQAADREAIDTRERMEKAGSQLRELRAELDRLSNAKSRLETTVAQAQKELNSKSQESAIIEILKDRIAQTVEEENDFNDAGELDSLNRDLDKLLELNEFAKSEVELDRIEKEVPNATLLIEGLEARLTSLKDLEASLASIKEVLAVLEQRKAGGVIESLENSFNQYFKSLDPHEHFKRVQVEVEEGQPPLYSIRAIGKEQSTYITTRFSSAQMNAAALALFLAKNEKIAGETKVILLDDPTQSMDESHKNAVCKSVTSLLRDRQVILATQDEQIKSLTKESTKTARFFDFSDWTIKGPTIS